MVKLLPLNQQVVVIFGASSGIGRLAAFRFAEAGARVVLAARNGAAIEETASEIEARGGEALAVVADTTDPEQVARVGRAAEETYGRLDTWIQVAGTAVVSLMWEMTPEEIRRQIEINLTGQAYAAQVAVPLLQRAGGGALIHITSVEAEAGTPYLSIYAGAKSGAKGFLDVLRMELQHERIPISVTNIMPSGINTPFFNHALTKLGVKPKPVPPIYDPGLVVDALLYAAEHPVAEMTVGGAGAMLTKLKRWLPRMTDRLLSKVAFRGQLTDEPRLPEAPHNLYDPVTSDTRIRGDFGADARTFSVQTYLATHPATARALAGVAVVFGAALLGWWMASSTTGAEDEAGSQDSGGAPSLL